MCRYYLDGKENHKEDRLQNDGRGNDDLNHVGQLDAGELLRRAEQAAAGVVIEPVDSKSVRKLAAGLEKAVRDYEFMFLCSNHTVLVDEIAFVNLKNNIMDGTLIW